MNVTPDSKLLCKLRIMVVLFRSLARAALPALLLLVLATGCSLFDRGGSSAISHKIDEEKDVISSNGNGVSNLDKLDSFMERGSGSQRIVQYTIEGDPIFIELRYKGGRLELDYDTTEDAFGSREVKTYSCSELVRTEEKHQLRYSLKGCEGDMGDGDLLIVSFDLSSQDKFEFVLKYGFNHRNEINTVNQSLVKDMLNGTASEISDFSLPQADRQSIYRKLVLANYLVEKQLSTSCNLKPYESYDLTVMINSAERHYAWSECDTGRDGKTMTEAADYIIGLVEAGDSYLQLPAATGGVK
ncbi:DUF4362 domain-containing protein [Paenibacillus sp. FSL R7-0297]|uniref:DUF4362 domain-containing protein n=1 Tax=unclassified Paenibacillus TaxID=185978 RepID=UPI0004F89814|nr:DUF4362 domain-containing protein [Paenibacillus sp. FSL R5-0912]AIQ40349.1 hypothetical protein R50912_10200 [Paenibacillus sp. FSL R5-0912]